MPSAAAAWTMVSAPVPFGRALDGLDSSELEIVQHELEEATAEFRVADGAYAFPMACRLFWGSK